MNCVERNLHNEQSSRCDQQEKLLRAGNHLAAEALIPGEHSNADGDDRDCARN
jgi:hypothetical protein